MVLLGGDLFHDNKPSRNTIVRVMDILSRYCLNDNPVAFQVISDQASNFPTGRVNFDNANYNIGLPVFTIHGNHDDPAGSENLSAVDILSTGNLVNYFGKVPISGPGLGKVRIAPVLLNKGNTFVSMYGLGNLRDERLCRLFQTPGCVEWVKPADTPHVSQDGWFNMFVLHQNRVPHTQNAKNYLREGYIAKFFDLVVWGHEHECLANPWASSEGGFCIMQPGSTVATALSEGESKRKHCVLLEINGQQWRSTQFALTTVRPFSFESVVLSEQQGLDPDDIEGVTRCLEGRVNGMIERAVRSRGPRTPKLPLIRLRVDYTGFSTINTQRFGQKFVGKVANPHDIVLWQKVAVRRREAKNAAAGAGGGAMAGQLGELVRPEALDEARIEDLIADHLAHDMQIIPEQELTIALHDFVEKDNKAALIDTVHKVLEETQYAAVRQRAAAGRNAGNHGGGASAAVPRNGGGRGRGEGPSNGGGTLCRKSTGRQQYDNDNGHDTGIIDEEEEVEEEGLEEIITAAFKQRNATIASRLSASTAHTGKQPAIGKNSVIINAASEEYEEDDEDIIAELAIKATPRGGTAAGGGGGAGMKSSNAVAAAASGVGGVGVGGASSRRGGRVTNVNAGATPVGKAASTTRRGGGGSQKQQATQHIEQDDDGDNDDDVDDDILRGGGYIKRVATASAKKRQAEETAAINLVSSEDEEGERELREERVLWEAPAAAVQVGAKKKKVGGDESGGKSVVGGGTGTGKKRGGAKRKATAAISDEDDDGRKTTAARGKKGGRSLPFSSSLAGSQQVSRWGSLKH